MSAAPDRLALRTAFEALRAGVPNRAAVRLLGSVEDAIEERFEAGLGQVWSDAPAPGLLFASGFGAGKSHLLGFLRDHAPELEKWQRDILNMIREECDEVGEHTLRCLRILPRDEHCERVLDHIPRDGGPGPRDLEQEL